MWEDDGVRMNWKFVWGYIRRENSAGIGGYC